MLRAILRNSGLNARRLQAAVRGWRHYVGARARFRELAKGGGMVWGRELPMLGEADAASGAVGAYFLQDQLVARWIYRTAPRRHVDVGSRLDGFVGSVSVFREVDVLDIRPQRAEVANVWFHQVNLMRDLPLEWLGCTDSLSCLHTIEHFGLGRYGDDLDPSGHLKGVAQLMRIVEPGGMLYLSTPIGPERVEFNAHRVFAARTLLGWFSQDWEIEQFAVIDDQGVLHEAVDWQGVAADRHFGCKLGVGVVAARKAGQSVAAAPRGVSVG